MLGQRRRRAGDAAQGTFTTVSAGGGHSCALRTDGTVACWGLDTNGRASPPAGSFIDVSAGRFHSCGVRADRTLACWGFDGQGQASPPAGTFTTVSAGNLHSCAIRTDGTLVCWGFDGDGVLSPPAGTFAAVSAGGGHSCAVRTDGTASCWGNDSFAQASPRAGTFKAISVGNLHTCAVRTAGTVACWGSNVSGQAAPPGGTFVSISAASVHSCAVRTGGILTCWGDDLFGKLGAAPATPSPAPPPGKVGRQYQHQFTSDPSIPQGRFVDVAGGLPAGLTLSDAGELAGTPTVDGEYRFTVSLSNGLFEVVSAPITLSIEPAQTAPVAHDDTYATSEHTALTVAAPGLLANDTDGEADPLHAQLRTAPGHGSVSMAADGSFTYRSDPGFSGTDTFTYPPATAAWCRRRPPCGSPSSGVTPPRSPGPMHSRRGRGSHWPCRLPASWATTPTTTVTRSRPRWSAGRTAGR